MGGLIKLSTKSCLQCKEIKTLRWRSKQRFCSPVCFQAWEKGKNNPYWKDNKISFTCPECKKIFIDRSFRLRTNTQCCSTKCARILMGKSRRAENHPCYVERQKTKHGYIKVHIKNHPLADDRGLIFEHRLIIEKHLGRYLKEEEVIHHINGIKDDNRIENLRLFKNNYQHMKFHTNSA